MSDPDDAKALRTATKGTGWVARDGTMSRRSETTAYHVYDFAGWYRFMAKPLVWDDIFWKIMHFEFNRRPSPTRHFWGHACPVKSIRAERITGATAQDRASQALRFGALSIDRLAGIDLTVETLKKLAIERDRPDDFVEAEVVERFATGDVDGARAICGEVLGNKRRVSHVHHTTIDGVSHSFFDLAMKWSPATA